MPVNIGLPQLGQAAVDLYGNYLAQEGISDASQNVMAGLEQSNELLRGYAGESQQTLEDIYQQNLEMLAPYQQAGVQALDRYGNLLSDPSQIMEDPAAQFRLQQGQQAVERSMAAKKLRGSGAAMGEALRYGQGFASQELDRSLQRQLPLIQAGRGATGTAVTAGSQYGGRVADIQSSLASALTRNVQTGAEYAAQRELAQSEAWTNTVRSLGETFFGGQDTASIISDILRQAGAGGGGAGGGLFPGVGGGGGTLADLGVSGGLEELVRTLGIEDWSLSDIPDALADVWEWATDPNKTWGGDWELPDIDPGEIVSKITHYTLGDLMDDLNFFDQGLSTPDFSALQEMAREQLADLGPEDIGKLGKVAEFAGFEQAGDVLGQVEDVAGLVEEYGSEFWDLAGGDPTSLANLGLAAGYGAVTSKVASEAFAGGDDPAQAIGANLGQGIGAFWGPIGIIGGAMVGAIAGNLVGRLTGWKAPADFDLVMRNTVSDKNQFEEGVYFETALGSFGMDPGSTRDVGNESKARKILAPYAEVIGKMDADIARVLSPQEAARVRQELSGSKVANAHKTSPADAMSTMLRDRLQALKGSLTPERLQQAGFADAIEKWNIQQTDGYEFASAADPQLLQTNRYPDWSFLADPQAQERWQGVFGALGADTRNASASESESRFYKPALEPSTEEQLAQMNLTSWEQKVLDSYQQKKEFWETEEFRLPPSADTLLRQALIGQMNQGYEMRVT